MKKGILIIALLGAFVFIVYQALMYYDNNFPYGRMRETLAVKPYEKPMLIMEAGTVPFRGGEAIYRAADENKLKSPLVNTDAAVIATPAAPPPNRSSPQTCADTMPMNTESLPMSR